MLPQISVRLTVLVGSLCFSTGTEAAAAVRLLPGSPDPVRAVPSMAAGFDLLAQAQSGPAAPSKEKKAPGAGTPQNQKAPQQKKPAAKPAEASKESAKSESTNGWPTLLSGVPKTSDAAGRDEGSE